MRVTKQEEGETDRDFAARLTADTRRADAKYDDAARSIIRDVRERGDSALYEYEGRFGGIRQGMPMRLSAGDIKAAYDAITRPQHEALKEAKKNLTETETATLQMLKTVRLAIGGGGGGHKDDPATATTATATTATATTATAIISRRFTPIRSVGCYIPGGLARYPSSAIMSIVPAAIAGVPRIVAVSPTAARSGEIDPLTIVAADMCGATEIYRIGGAHSIAALAYGTQTIPHVDKIVGPGGPYVTAAKLAASADVGIDMLAGPTELGILADSSAPPRLVAADLASQAEHSADTQCYVITASEKLAGDVNGFLKKAVPELERGRIIEESLSGNGFLAVAKNMKAAGAIADMLAPEHLQIMTKDPSLTAESITAPGLILLGSQTPSAASDYLLGSNHILPTNHLGRSRGPLSVLDFVKMTTVVGSSSDALNAIQNHMEELAKAEGLVNHYEAVHKRLGDNEYECRMQDGREDAR